MAEQTGSTGKPMTEEHECPICGFCCEKKPQRVPFDDLPENWRCPLCNTPKKAFVTKPGRDR